MITRHNIKSIIVALIKIVASIMMPAILLCFGACAQLPAFLPGGTATPVLTQSITPSPTTEASPSPTPFFINPVQTFYNLFRNETQSQYDAFNTALRTSPDANAMRFSFYLSEHMLEISTISTTIGRIFADETVDESGFAASYSGSVTGANEGYGTLRAIKNDESIINYTFAYDFTNGNSLYGTLENDAVLSFTICYYEIIPSSDTLDNDEDEPAEERIEHMLMSMSIEKTDDGWISNVWDEGTGTRSLLKMGESVELEHGDMGFSFNGTKLGMFTVLTEEPIEE